MLGIFEFKDINQLNIEKDFELCKLQFVGKNKNVFLLVYFFIVVSIFLNFKFFVNNNNLY